MSGKPLKDHLEAAGHKDAFEYIFELADKKTKLTQKIIRKIHSMVLISDAENKGRYTSVPVKIVGASNIPPKPYMIEEQMERLLNDYEAVKKDKHIIEAIAEFHLRFEGIHPFIDGNGRTGRLIMNLELIKGGLLPVNIKFADKLKYYDSFDKYFKTGNVEGLSMLIADYEIEELEKYIDIMKKPLKDSKSHYFF